MHLHPLLRLELARQHCLDLQADGAQPRVSSRLLSQRQPRRSALRLVCAMLAATGLAGAGIGCSAALACDPVVMAAAARGVVVDRGPSVRTAAHAHANSHGRRSGSCRAYVAASCPIAN